MKNTIIRVCDCIGYFVVLNLCWILCSIFGFRIPAIFNIDSLYHHSSHNTYPVVFLYIVYRLRFYGDWLVSHALAGENEWVVLPTRIFSYFLGVQRYSHECPFEETSLVAFRKRLGSKTGGTNRILWYAT